MGITARLFAIIVIAMPLVAGDKTFKDTGEFRDPKALKGYLNVKLDTYAHMVKEPNGTDCEWVMSDPSFDLDELRKAPVTFFPDSISRNGGWNDAYCGMFGGWYGNVLVTSF
jgi:hypothetical protein